ncbi:hypothetical protein [Hymenobacter bucti]|uniref:Uncharacterized protein n=1 Tax=Hymenobacter bucti TaxID=1844114 RepID=A0ABW4QX20_9BACT
MFKPLFYAALFVGLGSCKKDLTPLEQLPAATQDGNNTAGWLLDGRAWVPVRSTISTGPPVSGSWQKTKSGHALSVSFHQFSIEENWGAGFSLLDIRQAGTFTLNQSSTVSGGRFAASYGQYYHSRPAPDLNCYTGPDALGQLIITRFDTVQNIVSGTFEMTPRDYTTGTAVTITNGRFDVHFER